MTRPIALRIDDIGASSKRYNYHARNRFLNVGILRHRRLFGAWAPYRETTPQEWQEVFSILRRNRAKLTVGVTATWVEEDGSLTPFPEKFPEEAEVLREGASEGLLEIANHGYTHCVLQDQAYKPGYWAGNRSMHREFWDWLPAETHARHLTESQRILGAYFQTPPTTLVPPGNVFCQATVEAASRQGITHINCQVQPADEEAYAQTSGAIKILGNEHVVAFHDRELVLEGVSWLSDKLASLADVEFCFVREL